MTLSTSLIADALRAEGPASFILRGVQPVTCAGATVSGRARTLRYLPARAGVVQPGKARADLLESLERGDVMVCDTMGLGGLVFGDMAAMRAVALGLAGLVTDGVVRDTAAIEAMGLPVFAAGRTPGPGRHALVDWEADVPIQCGGALVLPGDWIVADADGAIAVPQAMRETVEQRTRSILDEEAFCQRLIERGHRLADVYPMPATLRPLYERYRTGGELPEPGDVGPLDGAKD